MGNYISCTLSIARSTGLGIGIVGAKLVLPTGELLHVGGGSHAAAEFMLDYPGHFLVSSASLRIGRRFAALSADEELEPGGAYVMFPMSRLGSTIVTDDVARVALAASKAARLARVSPAAAAGPLPVEPVGEKRYWKLEEMDAELAAEVRGRLSMSRSRKPTLETIVEESCTR